MERSWQRKCAVCGDMMYQVVGQGRPRQVCDLPECQRVADAIRQARRRRRLAGLPEDLGSGARGGRRTLRDQLLDEWARLAGVDPTPESRAALDTGLGDWLRQRQHYLETTGWTEVPSHPPPAVQSKAGKCDNDWYRWLRWKARETALATWPTQQRRS